jgi:thiamine transport system substrate-binding protein
MTDNRFFAAVLLCFFTAAALSGAGASEKGSAGISSDEQVRSIRVYAYDSFVSEWGPGPAAAALFEERYGIAVNMVSGGDSGQVLQKAIIEKSSPKADIIIGIDDNLLYRALKEDILIPYCSPALSQVPTQLLFDESCHVTPYDYSYFAVIFDTNSSLPKPESLEDLTDEVYRSSLILMDPRTSSPGLGFLHWTVSRYGEDYLDYWRRLKPSLLTVTDGWDTGYGLFTSGEAPMVLSYTTSPAYHVEYEDTDRYEALIFEEGHYRQIEGAGILKGTDDIEAAKLFIDFLLSPEVQQLLPLTNWMYPAVSGTELPQSYAFAPVPPAAVQLTPEETSEGLDSRLEAWVEVMSR